MKNRHLFGIVLPAAAMFYIVLTAIINDVDKQGYVFHPWLAAFTGLAISLVFGIRAALNASDGPCKGCCERENLLEELREALTAEAEEKTS